MENRRGIYRHFKGGLYRVLEIAQHTEQDQQMVVYQSLADGKVWVRPFDMFFGPNDQGDLRFTWVSEDNSEVLLSDQLRSRSEAEYFENLFGRFLRQLIHDFEGQVLFGRLILKRSRMRTVLTGLLKQQAELDAVSAENVRNLRRQLDRLQILDNLFTHLSELADADETSHVAIYSAAIREDGKQEIGVVGKWTGRRVESFTGRTLDEAVYRAVRFLRDKLVSRPSA